jgi:hypothetical protein
MADSANALNGKGKWKCTNNDDMQAAAATESKARP